MIDPPLIQPAQASGWDCHVHLFDTAQPVRDGHYTPADARLDDLTRQAQPHGIGRFVLVQPSVYGSNNQLVLQALAASGGRHRGVVVLDEPPDDTQLAQWHQLGVRGVRLNLFSPVGDRARDWAAHARQLAAAIGGSGWHLQWYARPQDLPALADLQVQCEVPFVLDHFASLGPDDAAAHPYLSSALQRLADAGAWIKLSAPYRVRGAAHATRWRAHAQDAARAFSARTVWGSDWPHTAFEPGQAPRYGDLVADASELLGNGAFAALVTENAARLYN